ncbi:MAG: CoA transferase [Gammaproteobacteria bacterium]|nr:CoA transferase [Gammaproteobacteria bacterium]NIP88512.1 CoA transferase [Gammaproteobacteria bacterium]NIR23233.1 CoA transferase [Gammaproteobacteria bacterium]NIS04804.1 CoA transferase [Gammaproteobacteria bacterium]NIU40082.1 CoA transferase [Gammaproteobacteria bacterium]
MTLPLEGVRVLTVEQYGAGPFGTMFLADQGAEVIKIENPHDGGDIARDVGPFFFAEHDSVFYHSFNRNKKSMALDLGKAEGQEVLHDLVASADALTSNLRGDVPEKLGLTYAHLEKFNAKFVCAHLSAYGRTGPRASWPGFDYLMQAEAGFLSLTGEPQAPPARFGLSVVDFMTGLGLAYAVLAGLTAARATGVGRDMDVSLFDMALANTNYLAGWYLNEGHRQERLPRSAHPSLTPCQLYPTRDGWIFIMCNKEKFWPALCERVERPEWATDARFKTFADRLANRDALTGLLDEALARRDTAEWLSRFAGSVPAAPVNDIAEALENPFVTDHDRLQTLVHPSAGEYRLVAPPVRTGEPPPARPAPALGEHTDALLAALGYDERRRERLRASGVI